MVTLPLSHCVSHSGGVYVPVPRIDQDSPNKTSALVCCVIVSPDILFNPLSRHQVAGGVLWRAVHGELEPTHAVLVVHVGGVGGVGGVGARRPELGAEHSSSGSGGCSDYQAHPVLPAPALVTPVRQDLTRIPMQGLTRLYVHLLSSFICWLLQKDLF